MSLLRSVCVLAVFMTVFLGVGYAQDKKTFPTDAEIDLLLTQADRAMQQYKLLIDQEETQLGKSEAVDKDRQVIKAINLAVKAFRTRPQGFNGPLGFSFFEWLDDASRNASLCAFGAENQSTLSMMAGNIDRAKELAHFAQSCLDMSTLIYTVSENAGALYTRYVEAEQELAAQGADVAQRCVDVLKKNGLAPQK
ncbi:MAG TPA: hypothetical protein VGQ94_00795 [Terriglobales bacterium]|nr:hypothetical protein [Terriglobales bacterium]